MNYKLKYPLFNKKSPAVKPGFMSRVTVLCSECVFDIEPQKVCTVTVALVVVAAGRQILHQPVPAKLLAALPLHPAGEKMTAEFTVV